MLFNRSLITTQIFLVIGLVLGLVAMTSIVNAQTITDLGLEVSSDDNPGVWSTVPGNLVTGFNLQLDPLTSGGYYYLRSANVVTSGPVPDADYPFLVTGYPSTFFQYWDARGVNVSATPGTWQEWMWQIINGSQPQFYVRVGGGGTTFELIDGLLHDFASTDTYLRINDDYPSGAYSYSGNVNGTQINVNTLTESTYSSIPTISEWGMIVMTLLLLITGTLILRRQLSFAKVKS